jgi:hypothetical protein
MRPDDPEHARGFRHEGRQDPLAERRVLLDLLELGRRERPRLVEDVLAGPDLPDVVQLPAEPDLLEPFSGVAELDGGLDGVARHPGGVAAGVGVLGLERVHQHLHAVDERLLVAPVELPHPALEVLLVESVLEHQVALLQRLVHPGADLFDHDGLGDIVERPELQALDGGAHLRHPGQHDHGHIGVAPDRFPQEGHPVHLGHVDVGDAHRHLALSLQRGQGFRAGRGLDRGQPVRRDDARQHVPDLRVIIDDKTASGGPIG